MKYGRTLMELGTELIRQRDVKRDYLLDTDHIQMDYVADSGAHMLTLHNPMLNCQTLVGVNDIAHRQIGTQLGIPLRYYNKMREENPLLLADNVNSWMHKQPSSRMIRTLDGTARAFLSDRYRVIDNFEVANAVLPVIADMPDARIESCELTDERMYIKVVNPRLTADVVPGDVVQSGVLITNSEVGEGCVKVQPLLYRLVCTNGMVVADRTASSRTTHLGRGNMAGEDYTLYSTETLLADNNALMLKIRDTVRASADLTRFQQSIQRMKDAREAKITARSIPDMIELAAADYGFTKPESEGILQHLLRDEDMSLYGLANAVTRAAQDVKSYDRSTEMESIGYSILTMSGSAWSRLNNTMPKKK